MPRDDRSLQFSCLCASPLKYSVLMEAITQWYWLWQKLALICILKNRIPWSNFNMRTLCSSLKKCCVKWGQIPVYKRLSFCFFFKLESWVKRMFTARRSVTNQSSVSSCHSWRKRPWFDDLVTLSSVKCKQSDVMHFIFIVMCFFCTFISLQTV